MESQREGRFSVRFTFYEFEINKKLEAWQDIKRGKVRILREK